MPTTSGHRPLLRRLLHLAHRDSPERDGVAAERAYADAVAECLADDALTSEELAQLAGLRASLGIPQARADAIVLEQVRPGIEGMARAAVADRQLTDVELERMRRVARRLGLSEAAVSAVCVEAIVPILRASVERAVADRRYAPMEEERLRSRARGLGLPHLAFDDETEGALAHFRALWEIENNAMPVVPAPMAVDDGETCHLVARCRWQEPRVGGVPRSMTGIHIAAGARFADAALAPRRLSRPELQPLDSGTVCITSTHVRFAGESTEKRVAHADLAGLGVFPDGVLLEKRVGRAAVLMLDDARVLETAAVLLTVLMRSAAP